MNAITRKNVSLGLTFAEPKGVKCLLCRRVKHAPAKKQDYICHDCILRIIQTPMEQRKILLQEAIANNAVHQIKALEIFTKEKKIYVPVNKYRMPKPTSRRIEKSFDRGRSEKFIRFNKKSISRNEEQSQTPVC